MNSPSSPPSPTPRAYPAATSGAKAWLRHGPPWSVGGELCLRGGELASVGVVQPPCAASLASWHVVARSLRSRRKRWRSRRKRRGRSRRKRRWSQGGSKPRAADPS
ncbi:hypothetical protein BRADI_2g41685v3 [Brachypodium distachyon]|uniref:Uncharacterized protein n=1 Tax=Brachypodium distachyon TaxID=15368 RepID=A0A2K2DD80_BRADI|nr:hypothetical protein BRADI_2g41685v3 [Brachypodium distachyon]